MWKVHYMWKMCETQHVQSKTQSNVPIHDQLFCKGLSDWDKMPAEWTRKKKTHKFDEEVSHGQVKVLMAQLQRKAQVQI